MLDKLKPPKQILWKALSAVYSVLGFFACLPAMMSPMMFDAPGSTSSVLTMVVFFSVLTLPVSFFMAATVPWKYKENPKVKLLYLLPVVHLAIAAGAFMLLDSMCDGKFTC